MVPVNVDSICFLNLTTVEHGAQVLVDLLGDAGGRCLARRKNPPLPQQGQQPLLAVASFSVGTCGGLA